jgi:Lantibiotic biosynthesis dehydratase C-term
MANQPISLAEPASPAGVAPDWRSYHVFYHGERNHAVLQLVCPLVRELLACGAISRFFFIRYGLGGPHLRLRWSVPDERAAALAERKLEERACQFFASFPSTDTLPEEKIRQMNRMLVGNGPVNPLEKDPVYRDNSWDSFPVVFEQERYGGAESFPLALELFNLSSSTVLRGLSEHCNSIPVWSRTALLRFAVQLAWGFAADEEEFISLAGYAEHFMGKNFAPCLQEGDEIFNRRSAEFMAMLNGELTQLAAEDVPLEAHVLASGALCVARSLTSRSAQERWNAAASHIHMTANRLGINNAEEVYLSRVLYRAAVELRRKTPAEWKTLWRALFGNRAAGIDIGKIVAAEWRRFTDLRS